jgi:hypothetical protein
MQFDAQNFMNAVYTEVNDTKIIPCPAGEFHAQIEKIEPKSGIIGKGERTGETWASIQVTYVIEDQAVKQLVGRDTVKVIDGVMLDLTQSGGLDMGKGKNISLGRLREATGLNSPGKPFSPMMLVGQRVKVSVRHVPGHKDPSSLQAEISGVVKA